MPGMSQTIYKDGYDTGYDSGYDTGYGSGYDSGYDSGVLDLVQDGDISVERAAEKLHKTTDEIQKLLDDLVASTQSDNP